MRTVRSEDLNHARSEHEVVEMVRDFLAQWAPAELAEIPTSCRPGKIVDFEDISDCAYELTRCRVHGSSSQDSLIEMETFFANAVRRLSAIDGLARRTRNRSTTV